MQKILIAEDSKAMQAFYRTEIPDPIYEKKIVADGEAALEAYETFKPDIILLDMNMPLLNGYQTLEAIRTRFKDTTTTIVMVTSASEKSDIVACAKLGIQGYVVKPFKGKDLIEAIKKATGA